MYVADNMIVRHSFLKGFGSVIDLYGNEEAPSSERSANEADARAIFSDFAIVGEDIQEAIAKVENEEET